MHKILRELYRYITLYCCCAVLFHSSESNSEIMDIDLLYFAESEALIIRPAKSYQVEH